MRICLLTEGSYPYVVGGVSSWIRMLIEGMPEHEFIVYAIGAEEKDRGKFKCKIPENLVEIHEVFLDSILKLRSPGMKSHHLTAAERLCLKNLICGTADINLNCLLDIFCRQGKKSDPLEIFMSFDFFDVIQSAYSEKYNYLPFTDFFWTIRSMLLPLFYLLQQELPAADVYHSVATGYCGILGGIAAAVYKKPFIITEHGIYSREREEEIIKCSWAQGDFKSVWIQYFYSLARLSYQNAGRVFTLFEKNAETERSLGCAPEKIRVVPNGIHLERFAHIEPSKPPVDRPMCIGAVVRVVPIKDIVTLLRAFFLVKQAIPDIQLKIMGQYDEDPEYYEICRQTVETLQLADVEFTGSVDVAQYYGKMDLLVLSSISEGQPLAILEGLASRRPFVATDVGCCREVLYGTGTDEFGPAGGIVPAMDYEAMAGEIIKLARDFSLRYRLAENGWQRIASLYTYERFITAYREIYAEEAGRK